MSKVMILDGVRTRVRLTVNDCEATVEQDTSVLTTTSEALDALVLEMQRINPNVHPPKAEVLIRWIDVLIQSSAALRSYVNNEQG
jgi:hypothetical protein